MYIFFSKDSEFLIHIFEHPTTDNVDHTNGGRLFAPIVLYIVYTILKNIYIYIYENKRRLFM